jgi:hypothetical protein
MTNHLQRRRAATILFSLIVACLLGLSGLLAGSYFWVHLGPPANDPDDTDAYLCGLLVGGVMAIGGLQRCYGSFGPALQQKHRNPAESDRQLPINASALPDARSR